MADDALAAHVGQLLGPAFAQRADTRLPLYAAEGDRFELLLAPTDATGNEELDAYPVRLAVLAADDEVRVGRAIAFGRRLRAAGFEVLVDDELEGELDLGDAPAPSA